MEARLFIKVFGTVFLLSLTCVFMTISQLSFIQLMAVKHLANESSWYASMLVIMVIPEVLSFLKILWDAAFIAKMRICKWPKPVKLITGVILSVIEAGSTSCLSIVILPTIPGQFILPILNCFLLLKLFPSVSAAKDIKESKSVEVITTIKMRVLAGCVVLLSVIMIGVNLSLLNIMINFHIPLLILLSIGASLPLHHSVDRFIHGESTASRHNAGLLYVIMRIAVILISYVIAMNFSRGGNVSFDLDVLIHAFRSFSMSNMLILLVILNASFSLCSQILYILPNKKFSTAVLIILFTILSQVLAIVLFTSCAIQTIDIFNFDSYQCTIVNHNDLVVPYILGAFVLILPACAMVANMWLLKTKDEYLVQELPSTQRYSSIFLLQTSIVNTQILNEINETPTESHSRQKTNKRVFVCTTMYQEAEHEMERLLKSLNRVMTSSLLKENNISLECHIFLDNGAIGTELKDFGKQLLGLFEENFKLEPESGLLVYTPYGIQIQWQLNNGYLVYIHLKDNSKVKPKKRWSQVMYLKYILDFKSVNYLQDVRDEFPLGFDTLDQLESLDHIQETRSYYGDDNRPIEIKDLRISCRSSSLPDLSHTANFLLPEIRIHSVEDVNETRLDMEDAKSDSGIYVERNDLQTALRDEPAHNFLTVKNSSCIEIMAEESNLSTTPSSSSLNMSKTSNDCKTEDFILMTDADMSFDENSVMHVVKMFDGEPDIGGVCGRTHPIGTHHHPIVWQQMFDYAKDFWMVKSSQNIIGSVMCCPGCFSLFKFDALKEVFQSYSAPTSSLEDVFCKDTGEDRWMCTLMMLKGWKLRYASLGTNSTYCPEDTEEFMKQRRRWLLSDFANALVVFKQFSRLMQYNTSFSLVYVIYLLQLFFITVVYPGSTIIMLALGLELDTDLPIYLTGPIITLFIFSYVVLLLVFNQTHIQMLLSKILGIILGIATVYVVVSSAVIIIKSFFSADHTKTSLNTVELTVLLGLASLFIIAGFLHPTELHKFLLCGIPFLFYMPFMNIVIPLYSICNIVDQSWGTREKQVAKVKKLLRLPKIPKRKKKQNKASSRCGSFTSICSTTLNLEEYNEKEMNFWKMVVEDFIGLNVRLGMSKEERCARLLKLRNRSITLFLIVNGLWMALLTFALVLIDNQSTLTIIVLATLGLTPLIHLTGMIINKLLLIHDYFKSNIFL